MVYSITANEVLDCLLNLQCNSSSQTCDPSAVMSFGRSSQHYRSVLSVRLRIRSGSSWCHIGCCLLHSVRCVFCSGILIVCSACSSGRSCCGWIRNRAGRTAMWRVRYLGVPGILTGVFGFFCFLEGLIVYRWRFCSCSKSGIRLLGELFTLL